MERVSEHRVFLGLPVPIEIAHQLADWSAKVFVASEARLVSPLDLHTTVLFSSHMPTSAVYELVDLVAAARWRSVTASTQSVRFFGQSAIAITLSFDPVDLARIESIDLFPFRPFFFGTHAPLSPHVTVARARADANLKLHQLKPPEVEIEFTELALYESTSTNGSATYRILASSHPMP